MGRGSGWPDFRRCGCHRHTPSASGSAPPRAFSAAKAFAKSDIVIEEGGQQTVVLGS
ncbi:MAG: hypothetical protein HRU01_30005 [Myxococcales bacterium]|nr:hypothetical protein [Myxococcales bacterium]